MKFFILLLIILFAGCSKNNILDKGFSDNNDWTLVSESESKQTYIDLSSVQIHKLTLNNTSNLLVATFMKKEVSKVDFSDKKDSTLLNYIAHQVHLNNCCESWSNECEAYVNNILNDVKPDYNMSIINGNKHICLIDNTVTLTEIQKNAFKIFDEYNNLIFNIIYPNEIKTYLNNKLIAIISASKIIEENNNEPYILKSNNIENYFPWINQYIIPKLDFFRTVHQNDNLIIESQAAQQTTTESQAVQQAKTNLQQARICPLVFERMAIQYANSERQFQILEQNSQSPSQYLLNYDEKNYIKDNAIEDAINNKDNNSFYKGALKNLFYMTFNIPFKGLNREQINQCINQVYNMEHIKL